LIKDADDFASLKILSVHESISKVVPSD